MTASEFAEKLQQFVDQAKSAGIPLEDIISELEDIKDSIQEEVDDAEENPEEEDEEKESD
jgi:hypothetical protein